jgi:ABC-2 type transport system ATP-binding protein
MARAARASFDTAFAAERLDAVRVDGKRKVGELSGGEQSQVALTLALAVQAPLVLLDEPIASLDPLARRDFITLMTTVVRKRRATAVISSHLVADVAQICDWILVLTEGHLALSMSLDEARGRFGIRSGSGTVVRELAVDETADEVHALELAPSVIGTFTEPNGERVALTDKLPSDRPATLEEIVLGHMAAARTRRDLAP